MTTVYASIGNSDDKLTQSEWNRFASDFVIAIRRGATAIHGIWYSLPNEPYQNAVACFELPPDPVSIQHLKMRMHELATQFRQDSIAWAEVAVTKFIRGGAE